MFSTDDRIDYLLASQQADNLYDLFYFTTPVFMNSYIWN